MEDKKDNINEKTSSLGIVSFLSLEVFAFTVFTFTSSILTYAFLGITLFIGLIITSYKEIKIKGMSNFLYLLIPLIIYSLLVVVSVVGRTYIGTLEAIFIPFMVIAFIGCGYLFSYFKAIKLQTVFTVIYGALALYTVLGLFYSMVQFTPFYPLIYSNSYFYYNGRPSPAPIGDIAYSLIQFSFVEVSIEYFILFPSLLLTSVIGLFYFSPKKQTKLFILYAFYAFIAFLTLLFMSNIYTLLTTIAILILIALIVILTKLNLVKSKAIRIIIWIVLACFLLWILILSFLSQSEVGFLKTIHDAIASVPLIGKIFTLGRYGAIIDEVVNLSNISNLFGLNPAGSVTFSNSWLFDAAYLGGLFAFIAIIVLVVFGLYFVLKFFVKGEETILNKSLLLAFVVTFFGYNLINGDNTPYINYSNVVPVLFNGPGLITLFLLGYASIQKYHYQEISVTDISSQEEENEQTKEVETDEIEDE